MIQKSYFLFRKKFYLENLFLLIYYFSISENYFGITCFLNFELPIFYSSYIKCPLLTEEGGLPVGVGPVHYIGHYFLLISIQFKHFL